MKLSLINWHMIPRNTPLGAVPCGGLDAADEIMDGWPLRKLFL